MLCDVTLLRRHGMRLRPSELEPPVRGMLTVQMRDGQDTSFRRPVLTAWLRAPQGVSGMMVDVLLPIFDVRIVGVADGSMTLQGVELNVVDERVYEHAQMWRCTLVTGGAQAIGPASNTSTDGSRISALASAIEP